MNEHIALGLVNKLKIDRKTDHGLYLESEDKDDVLLPNAYVTEEMQVGDEIEVFIYTDSEDRYVATTLRPKAMLNEFGYFEVVDTNKDGAFVDWGLPKDLFVPKALQKIPLQKGMKFVFRVCLDERTDRLVAAHKFKQYIQNDIEELEENQKVALIVREKTPLGYKVIVENKYEAMIFHNEIFEDIWIGQKKFGYVKKKRSDRKLDISLQPMGKENEDIGANRVLKVLRAHGGVLNYNYKSSPEEVKELFSLSKKNYKKALTTLLEAKKIMVDEEGMKLL